MITGRDPRALVRSASDLALAAHQAGARVEWVAGDVRRANRRAQHGGRGSRRFGGLDILVNNAGVGILVEAARR